MTLPGNLTLFRDGGRRRYILTFGQAPNSESKYVNHAEPELLSQAFDEIKVRIREANGCGLEFFVLHES